MKILVTGGDGGIGSAIVASLTHAGHDVIVTTRADTDVSSVEAVHTLKTRVGKVDWIVAAHGYIDTETVLEQQAPSHIEETFEVNTLSLFWLAREFLPDLLQGMVVLSSSAGLTPNGHYAAYSASKAAAHALIQALARNHKTLTFIAIAPGPTNTAMRERVAGDAAKMQSPTVIAEEVKNIVARENDYTSGDIILIKDGACSIASRL